MGSEIVYKRQRSNAGADDEESVYFRAALNYISSGHYKEALNVLNNIPQHSAQWYYYSSIANQGLGNNAAALEQAKKATEMEPQNAEYAGWRQRMESGGSWYTGRQTQYGGMPVSSGSGFCWKLCLANLICNLCCGGGDYAAAVCRQDIIYDNRMLQSVHSIVEKGDTLCRQL